MFGRHLELSLVKNKKNGETIEESAPTITVDDITHIAKMSVKYVAVGVVSAVAAYFLFSTASEIAVNRLSIEEKKQD